MAASLLAFALSAALVIAARMRGEQVKVFEVSDAALFGGIVVVAFLRDSGSQTWLADHADAVSNIGLTFVAFVSYAVGRPFTAPYTEARFGGADPRLLSRLDRWSTLIWGVALFLASVVTVYGEWYLDQPDNLWTAWILQTLPLIAALDLTLWIDKRAIAHASDEPWLDPPPVMLARDLLAWLVPTGAASLAFSGGPAWLGWGLIAVGVVGTAVSWLRLDRERSERLAARPAAESD